MHIHSGSLRARLIVLVLFAVVPLTALMFYTASEQRRLEVSDFEGDVLTIATVAAREEEHLLDGARQLVETLAVVPERSPASTGWNLAELVQRYSRYRNIGLVDSRGRLYCSALPFEGVVDAAETSWFKSAQATGDVVVREETEPVTGRPAVVVAYPVLADDRRVRAVAFAALDTRWLDAFKSRIEKNLPDGAAVSRIDLTGRIMADSQVWPWGSLEHSDVFQAIRSQRSGTVVSAAGPDGVRRLYAFSPLSSALGERDGYLVVGIPEERLSIAANRLLVHNLVLLGLLSLGVVLAAWFGSDLLVLRPIRAMLAAAERLAGGDLTARTGLPVKRGELGQMALAFDSMAAALQRRADEHRRAEAAILESREQLRKLATHLESIREEERTRLAREIHDVLGQGLTAVKMDIAWLSRRISPEDRAMAEKIRAMDAVVDQTVQTVQRLSGELRPSLLDDLGLEAAIEWQAEEFQKRSGIGCRVKAEIADAVVGRDHATAIFRILQETLTNVIRHARASRVSILLTVEHNRLLLRVSDNGQGITDEAAGRVDAFGLIGMRERVLALKGELSITGKPGAGTTVAVSIPLA